jgi:hypothetical protein
MCAFCFGFGGSLSLLFVDVALSAVFVSLMGTLSDCLPKVTKQIRTLPVMTSHLSDCFKMLLKELHHF